MTTFLKSLVDGAANWSRNQVLSDNVKVDRAARKENLKLIQLGAVVSAAVAVLFFTIFPTVFNLVLTGVIGLVASDIANVSANVIEMINNASVETIAEASNESRIQQISKGTFLTGPILRWAEVQIPYILPKE